MHTLPYNPINSAEFGSISPEENSYSTPYNEVKCSILF